MRDSNHDGRIDKLDYYDDLGGAYYFAPHDLYSDCTPCESGCAGVLYIVVGTMLIIIAIIL